MDVLIGVNVISKDGDAFAGTKLRGLAEAAGMKLMPDGMFHYFDDNGDGAVLPGQSGADAVFQPKT